MRGHLVVASLLVGVFCSMAAAETIVVSPDGTGDYPTIQAAIDAATHGDEVVLEPGTYTGEGNRDLDFRGMPITVRSVDPDDPVVVAATVINCQGTLEEPHRGCVFRNSKGPSSVLAGLTITNGAADGGAIACIGSGPTITRCQLIGNAAVSGGGEDSFGGGIYCYQSSAAIIDCEISKNVSKGGGGIYCQGGSPRVIRCKLTFNTSSGAGGGMLAAGNIRPEIVACRIAHNWSASEGAGVSCRDGRLAEGVSDHSERRKRSLRTNRPRQAHYRQLYDRLQL